MKMTKSAPIVILAIVSIALLAGCTSAGERTVKAGDNVSVDYIGTYTNGTVFDTSIGAVAMQAGLFSPYREYKPINFTVGEGQVIKGFSEGVIGMKVGESRDIVVPPENGYGAYSPLLVKPVPMEMFTDQNITPYVNQTLYDSYYRPIRVDSIDWANSTVYMDYNHPMAGKTLRFNVTLRNIG